MAPVSKPERHPGVTAPDAPPSWEERSARRVLDTGRDQILDRSRRIVEAAYELLKDEGLDGLTIRAVLTRTGLSRRAFYERFEGKDDLVLAVFEHTIRMAADHYSEQVETLDDPMERLRLIVTLVVLGSESLEDAGSGENDRRGAAMSREHLRLAESRPRDLQLALRPLIALIARQLSDGMEQGRVREGDPNRLASLVYNLVSTTVQTELLVGEGAGVDIEGREQLAGDLWEFCWRAIAAPSGATRADGGRGAAR
jgi:AcrR family transcriptional regulator